MIYNLGDRARFPLKFRTGVLITAAIVVADIKEDRNAAKDHGSVSAIIFLNNYLAADSDIQTDILTDKFHFV